MPTIYTVLRSVFPGFFTNPFIGQPETYFISFVKQFVENCKRVQEERKLQLKNTDDGDQITSMLSLQDAQFAVELLEKPYMFDTHIHQLVHRELPLFYKNTLCQSKFDVDEFKSFLVFYRTNKRFPERKSFAAMSLMELKCVFFREKMCMWTSTEELAKNFDDFFERDLALLGYSDSLLRHSDSNTPSDLHSKIYMQPNSPCYRSEFEQPPYPLVSYVLEEGEVGFDKRAAMLV
jgi:hypothetical protein